MWKKKNALNREQKSMGQSLIKWNGNFKFSNLKIVPKTVLTFIQK